MTPAEDEYDPLRALADAIDEAGLTICFWDGAPPCPQCGGSHSFKADKVETPEWQARRRRIEAAKEGAA